MRERCWVDGGQRASPISIGCTGRFRGEDRRSRSRRCRIEAKTGERRLASWPKRGGKRRVFPKIPIGLACEPRFCSDLPYQKTYLVKFGLKGLLCLYCGNKAYRKGFRRGVEHEYIAWIVVGLSSPVVGQGDHAGDDPGVSS